MKDKPTRIESHISDKYSGKKSVVLGGSGFVGGWLRSILSQIPDTTVFSVDNLSRGNSSSANLLYEGKNAIDLRQDVRDIDELANILRDADFVFNLTASVAGVLHNQEHHVEMYKQNIEVLLAPVLAASMAGVPAFLQTSSVCVYSPEHNSPSHEEFGMKGDPHPANAGYAEAKRDGERVAMWSKIPRVVIVRPSNVAGYGDYFDDRAHVIPAFVKRAHEMHRAGKNKFIMYGNPRITREFIHPADVAKGMIYALALGANREAYNIGTFGLTQTTMESLASRILAGFGLANSNLVVKKSAGGGDPRRWSSGSKMLKLGWSAVIDLDTIVSESIADYLNNWAPQE